jgi:hypothetical protein
LEPAVLPFIQNGLSSFRHPGESRDPLNQCNLGSGAHMLRIKWIPASAGMTKVKLLRS